MKFYAVVIEPASGFGTPLKGDTMFGQFCWEAAWDKSLLEGGLEAQLEAYGKKPFLVFSSAFPKLRSDPDKIVCALRRPALPPRMETFSTNAERIEALRKRKEEKKRQWVVHALGDAPMHVEGMEALNSEELLELCVVDHPGVEFLSFQGAKDPYVNVSQSHNTINRLSWTTGDPPFAPYSLQVGHYLPGMELILFVLLDEDATDIDRVVKGLKRIGQFGFGRDASIGMGRFRVKESMELALPTVQAGQACYTLAPCVPESGQFGEYYFSPFIRFGRHGGALARSENPFKNPVVMADEGAVFIPLEGAKYEKPYMGRAVQNVSKALAGSVVQGYAPILPLMIRSWQ